MPETYKVERSDEKDLTSITDISMLNLLRDSSATEKRPVNRPKDFITVRLDQKLKDELIKAADVERRSLSSFCRLLIEYSWNEYLKAGSLHDLLSSVGEQPKTRSVK